jgi:hypothetical protein
MWRLTVALLLVGEALAQRRSVSHVTCSEAMPILQREATRRAKVQVQLHSGKRVKGRVVAADPRSVLLDKNRSHGWRQIEWVRLASSGRKASNVDRGITAGATIGALLYVELRSLDARAPLASRVWLGTTIAGALIGSQTGRVDTGHYYVLRDDPEATPQANERTTPLPLPLRPSLPLPPQ